jgi:hypothetical protein
LYNALDLIQDYEKSMNNITILSDRLSRINLIIDTFNSSSLDDYISKNSSITKLNSLKIKTFESSEFIEKSKIVAFSQFSSFNTSNSLHIISIRRSSRKRKSRERD